MASRPTRPLLPPLHSVLLPPPPLSLSLTLSPLSRRFHSVGPCLSYTYIEGRGHVPQGTVRTTGETVGPECDATKTVDKEQGPEEEDEERVVHSHWKKREGRREQESSLITISLCLPPFTASDRKEDRREEDAKNPWQYRVRTVTRTVNVDHGRSETDIATL